MKLFSNLRGDFFGALMTSFVAIPISIALGVAAYAPLGKEYLSQGAISGIYALIIATTLVSLLWGVPGQITCMTAPISLMIASTITDYLNHPELANMGIDLPQVILPFVSLTIICGGFFQLLLSLIGGGKLIKYIPYPVVAGFMNGIALIFILKQIHPILGVDTSVDLASIFTGHAEVRYEALIAGLVTIACSFIAERFIKTIPGDLIGIVFGLITYFVIGLIINPDLLQLKNNPLIVGPFSNIPPFQEKIFSFFSNFK